MGRIINSPGEDDIRRLAREVRASFQLPRQMHELEPKEAPFEAPQHCHVSTTGSLLLQLYLSMLAKTSGRFPGRRQLHMPGPCSILLNKRTLQRGMSGAFWQRASWNWRREVKFYLSYTDEEVLGECLSLRKKKTVPWILLPPVSLLPLISPVLPMSLRHNCTKGNARGESSKVCQVGKNNTPILASVTCQRFPNHP